MKKDKLKEPYFLYYNGFEIQVLPQKVEKWSSKVRIYKHRGNKIKKRLFMDKSVCSSERDAVKNGFKLGQEIIDGKATKLRVSDM